MAQGLEMPLQAGPSPKPTLENTAGCGAEAPSLFIRDVCGASVMIESPLLCIP